MLIHHHIPYDRTRSLTLIALAALLVFLTGISTTTVSAAELKSESDSSKCLWENDTITISFMEWTYGTRSEFTCVIRLYKHTSSTEPLRFVDEHGNAMITFREMKDTTPDPRLSRKCHLVGDVDISWGKTFALLKHPLCFGSSELDNRLDTMLSDVYQNPTIRDSVMRMSSHFPTCTLRIMSNTKGLLYEGLVVRQLNWWENTIAATSRLESRVDLIGALTFCTMRRHLFRD